MKSMFFPSWDVVGTCVAATVAAGALVVVLWRARARPATGEGHLSQAALLQGLIGLFVAALAGLISAALAFLWPTFSGGQPSPHRVEHQAAIRAAVRVPEQRYHLADGQVAPPAPPQVE